MVWGWECAYSCADLSCCFSPWVSGFTKCVLFEMFVLKQSEITVIYIQAIIGWPLVGNNISKLAQKEMFLFVFSNEFFPGSGKHLTAVELWDVHLSTWDLDNIWKYQLNQSLMLLWPVTIWQHLSLTLKQFWDCVSKACSKRCPPWFVLSSMQISNKETQMILDPDEFWTTRLI